MKKKISNEDELPVTLAKDITPLQVNFILKLLENGSVTKTAEELNISRRTFYNWNEKEAFRKQMREIKNKLLGDAVSDLSFLLIDCIQAYREGLKEDQPVKVRTKTANSLIDRLGKMREVSELEERIARLEKLIEKRG